MSQRELYVSPSQVFSGSQTPFAHADYVVLGVPFDVTSTFRTGARFAPNAIREASLNIETYSFRAGVDVEDLKIHDLGNLDAQSVLDETLRRLELVVKEILAEKKVVVIIGGEHTLTLGVARAVGKETAIVSFDAHLDLRNKYMGLTVSHTTFMRRMLEENRSLKIVEVGTRAVCKEELEYAKKNGVNFITSAQTMKEEGVEKTVEFIKEFLSGYKRVYLTIDMDVLDPAFAPAVQNPEPDGLSINTFLDVLCGVCDHRVVALDLVEVTPSYDRGVTAIQAAKIIFEALCSIEKGRRNRS